MWWKMWAKICDKTCERKCVIEHVSKNVSERVWWNVWGGKNTRFAQMWCMRVSMCNNVVHTICAFRCSDAIVEEELSAWRASVSWPKRYRQYALSNVNLLSKLRAASQSNASWNWPSWMHVISLEWIASSSLGSSFKTECDAMSTISIHFKSRTFFKRFQCRFGFTTLQLFVKLLEMFCHWFTERQNAIACLNKKGHTEQADWRLGWAFTLLSSCS